VLVATVVPELEVPLAVPLEVPLVVPLVPVPLEAPLVVPLVAVPLEAPVLLGVVDVQKVPAHVAPSPAHLQFVDVVHQPSMLGTPVPASMHSCMLGFAVQLQICVPHAEPGQSVSLVHAAALAERAHPRTDNPMATTERARPLNFMARTS
jgi:hypothetical protein